MRLFVDLDRRQHTIANVAEIKTARAIDFITHAELTIFFLSATFVMHPDYFHVVLQCTVTTSEVL